MRIPVFDAHSVAIDALDGFLGTTVDVAPDGLLLRLAQPLHPGEVVHLRFFMPGASAPTLVEGDVIRIEPSSEPAAAIAFRRTPKRFAAYLTSLRDEAMPFTVRIIADADRRVVKLAGGLHADVELLQLQSLVRPFELHLRDFRIMEQTAWHFAARELRAADPRPIALFDCPVSFVELANDDNTLLHGFDVKSFFAPYRCDGCGTNEEHLLFTAAVRNQLAAPPVLFTCSHCHQRLKLDAIARDYFKFLITPKH
jgi:hypothetical protein